MWVPEYYSLFGKEKHKNKNKKRRGSDLNPRPPVLLADAWFARPSSFVQGNFYYHYNLNSSLYIRNLDAFYVIHECCPRSFALPSWILHSMWRRFCGLQRWRYPPSWSSPPTLHRLKSTSSWCPTLDKQSPAKRNFPATPQVFLHHQLHPQSRPRCRGVSLHRHFG